MARITVRRGGINRKTLDSIKNSPEVLAVMQKNAVEMVALAKAAFLAQQIPNEPTFPLYVNSFYIDHVFEAGEQRIHVGNNDPVSGLVEFGAHAGGITPVLRYRPFGRAVAIMIAT